MRPGVAIVLCSLTDTRSLLAVGRELRGRGIPVRFLILGGPDCAALQTLVAAAGWTQEVIGRDLPLNADRLLRDTSPAVLVLGADSLYFPGKLLEAAKRQAVATVLVQEAANELVPQLEVRKRLGSLLRQPSRAFFRGRTLLANGDLLALLSLALRTLLGRPRTVPGYGFGEVDLFCVATERVRRVYEARGARAKRIVATGIPELFPAIALQAVRYDYLILTQPFDVGGFVPHGWKQSFFGRLARIIGEVRPGARILWKFHPSEQAREYEALGDLAVAGDLATAIALSDVVVSVHSAALCAALANGRPAIAYVPPELRAATENMIVDEMSRLGLLVDDDRGFALLLQRLADHREEAWKPAAARETFALCTDGHAGGRVADLIVAEIGGAKPEQPSRESGRRFDSARSLCVS